MLPRKALTHCRLSRALEKIVTDNIYRENMQRLKRLQDPIDGAAKAAAEMVRFLESRY